MSNPHKILVVDEDSGARQDMARVLTGEGYDVVTVSSGEDALWELDKDTYDAVFTALAMRGRSGRDVAEEIHLGTPGLPVVVITGQGRGDDRERFEAAGVSERGAEERDAEGKEARNVCHGCSHAQVPSSRK